MKKNFYNVPVHAPLFPDPFVPYSCKNFRSIYAVADVNETELKRILSYTPFDFVDNKVVISVSDFSNTDKVSYMDCAIVLPIKYKNKYGGYYIYEYENNDAAIAAGRDLWGYPKKYAAIRLESNDGNLIGAAQKNGEEFLQIKLNTNKEMKSIAKPITTPHYNIRTIPKPAGGIQLQEIIERDTSPDFVLHEEKYYEVSMEMKSTQSDPLHLLGPVNVIGGGVISGDFYATEENGWGKVVGNL